MEVIKNRDDEGSIISLEVMDDTVNRIKSGEIVAVCVTMISKGGGSEYITGGLYSSASMVGALEITKLQVLGCDVV